MQSAQRLAATIGMQLLFPISLLTAAALNVPQDFGLTIDIDSLIKQYDADGSGEIDYEEFREMLS